MEKIAALGGSHRAEILRSNIVHFNTRKHTNESIFYSVNELEQAMIQKRQASFHYFDLNEKHERVYRKEQKRYIVDPIALVFLSDNYYLMCYSTKYKMVDLSLDAGMGRDGDVGEADQIEYELSVFRGEPVAGKGFDAEQFLHGVALFLFFCTMSPPALDLLCRNCENLLLVV